METAMISLFHEDDPARVAFEDFQETFGSDDVFIVLLEPPQVFEAGFLEQLEALHHELADQVPHVAAVTSLVNARLTQVDGDLLMVGDMMENVPSSPEEMALFRETVLRNPLYRDSLVTADGGFTAIVIEPELWIPPAPGDDSSEARPIREPEHAEMLARIDVLVEPLRKAGIEVHVSGNPVVSVVLEEAILADTSRLVPMTMVVVILLLAVLFRRISGVVLPLVAVTASVVSSLGVMAALDIPLGNATTILPTLLLVVGIADAVHVLTIFYQAYDRGLDKSAAIIEAFGHSGPPVILTTLTTAAAFASFGVADVAWVAELGVAAPIGVGFALLYTVLLLPALTALIPLRRRKASGSTKPGLGDGLLAWIGRASAGRSGAVVGAWVVLTLVAGVGFRDLRLSQNGM
jgi:predicted RND superfamily exporter protein